MTAPLPFISTTDLVNYMGRGGTADPGVILAVDAACDICRDGARGQIITRVVGGTMVLDGSGTDALVLSQVPVSAAGTVLVDGGTVTDYVLRADGVLIRKTAGTASLDSTIPTTVWPAGRQNIQVTADTGYVDSDVPRSIRMVALAVANRIVTQGAALSESIGNVTVRYGVNSTDLTAGERMILDHASGR